MDTRKLTNIIFALEGETEDARYEAARDAILALFEEERARLEKQLAEYEEREASVCPEDFGCDEYIPVLERKLAEAEAREAKLMELANEVAKDYEDAADWKDAIGKLQTMARAALAAVEDGK